MRIFPVSLRMIWKKLLRNNYLSIRINTGRNRRGVFESRPVRHSFDSLATDLIKINSFAERVYSFACAFVFYALDLNSE